MNKYKVIAIIGEAGSGKDTLLKEVLAANPEAHAIVSFTTRPPREGEVDGKDYHYISGEEFARKVLENEMLEATCFNDWFYGTAYDSLSKDKVNIGVFNPEGIDSMMTHKDIILVVYYAAVPEKLRLMRQLNRESNPDIDEIFRRLKADRNDFYDLDFHYNWIENSNYDQLSKNVEIISAAMKHLKAADD